MDVILWRDDISSGKTMIESEGFMFTKNGERDFKPLVDGVKYKTLAFGEKTSIGEFTLDKGSVIPSHSHHHEQTGYVVSGHLIFYIAGERFEARPGDGWNIPSDVEHRVDVIENSVVIEVFSPRREDYLP